MLGIPHKMLCFLLSVIAPIAMFSQTLNIGRLLSLDSQISGVPTLTLFFTQCSEPN